MNKYWYLLFAVVLMASCQESSNTKKLSKVKWLVGDWQMKMEEATFYESWQIAADNRLEGKGLLVNINGDTLFNEQLAIVLRDDILYYEPIVSNQNNGEQISFKETLIQDTLIRFENPQHDFPQVITYSLTKDRQIHAFVSGKQEGKEHRSDFYFEQIK
ncbi:MAG: DUF6265 family protein [Flavipsychrobacter sp.]